jgi:hypothetical protein
VKEQLELPLMAVPQPIAPSGTTAESVSHPAPCQSFMYVLAGPEALFAVPNALSERLVVSTRHDDQSYR